MRASVKLTIMAATAAFLGVLSAPVAVQAAPSGPGDSRDVRSATAWSGFENLGGTATSAPAVASWADGRLDVFVRGTDSALWHRWYSGGWSGWENLGGTLTSAPAVTSWGANRLDVFARDTGSRLVHKWRNGTSWSGW